MRGSANPFPLIFKTQNMRVKLIKPCPKFAYPAGYEFELDDQRTAYWTQLGYMVAMGASPVKLPEKPQPENDYRTANMKRKRR